MLIELFGTSEECSLFSHLCKETNRLLKATSYSMDLDTISVDVTIYHLNPRFESLRNLQSLSWSKCSLSAAKILKMLDPAEDMLIRLAIEYNIVG